MRSDSVMEKVLPEGQAPSFAIADARVRPVLAHSATGRGWLPALVLIGSLGVFVIAQAMARATVGLPGAEPLFWTGILFLYLPVIWRQSMRSVSRGERIALIVWLGLGLYMVKLLRSPTEYVFHDEFAHWRTAFDIIQTHHLFHINTLQEISAQYPGLEIATAALVNLTGLSIFQAGTLLVAVARLIGVLAVYLLYEQVGGSQRVAGIAAALYMAYPNFVFWSSQYAYESLSAPLAILTLFIVTRSTTRAHAHLLGLKILGLLTLLALVITHHLTAYTLTLFLFLVTVVSAKQPAILRVLKRFSAAVSAATARRPAREDETPGVNDVTGRRDWRAWGAWALLALVASLAWSVFVGHDTVEYLLPHFRNAISSLAQLMFGAQSAKPLFDTPVSAFVTPLWERTLSLTSVALVLLGIVVGLFQLWRHYTASPVALAFGLGAIAYPFSLVLRLTSTGSEISNRALDFLFVALGFVLALSISQVHHSRRSGRVGQALFALLAMIIFAGAIPQSLPYWARLPGPYAVGGDTRALQPESRALATWSFDLLGPGNRVIGDQTNILLAGSYGRQNIVDGLSWLYFSPTFSRPVEFAVLQQRQVDYLIVDRRLSWMPSKTVIYFELGEPRRADAGRPMDLARLAKFDNVTYLSRVFDSGNIIVYGTGRKQPIR